MLSNFWRNGKRKAKRKGSEQTSFTLSTDSSDSSARVFNIGDPSLDHDESGSNMSNANGVGLRSPLVHLNLPADSEEWFPRDLLRERRSARSSLIVAPGTTAPTPDISIKESIPQSHSGSSSEPSLPAEDTGSGHAPKKSIPAPIMIPDLAHLLPNVQVGGQSAPTTSALPTKTPVHADETALNPNLTPSSENISAISGTTLARALIANSFVLSSGDHRKSPQRSGITRQDSATLPHGETLSDLSSRYRDKHTSGTASTVSHDSRLSSRPSSIPPVPPVPMGPFLRPRYTPGLPSGSSTSSEYPVSDSYTTSPEGPSHARRISSIQEVPSPMHSTPTMSAQLTPEKSITSTNGSSQMYKSGAFDVPNSASDSSSPIGSVKAPQDSSHAESFALSSADHTLDEFDFLPPEAQLMISPGSDSSASYIAPLRDASRRERRRRAGGSNAVTSTQDAVTDNTLVSPDVNAFPSAASNLDSGEFNYPVTVSPEMTPSRSESSASAGYQTFPETPALFSPLWSSRFSGFRSDSQRIRSQRSVYGRGAGRIVRHGTLAHPHVAKANENIGPLQRSQTAAVPRNSPSPKREKRTQTPSAQSSPKLGPVEGAPLWATERNGIEELEEPEEAEETKETREEEESEGSEGSDEDRSHFHPLTHVSTSSSKLEPEDALQAFARHSGSSLPSMMMSSDNVSSTPPDSPHLVPLPPSVATSPVSAQLNESIFSSPLSSASTPAQIINQPQPRSQLAATTEASLLGSSFLPSPSPSPSPMVSLRDHLSRTTSPIPRMPLSRPSSDHSVSQFSIAPPPYHVVVSERTQHHSGNTTPEPQLLLSNTPPSDAGFERSREASTSTVPDSSSRSRVRSRPRLPGGPRKPSGTAHHIPDPLVPQRINQSGSGSSVITRDRGSSSPTRLPWPKLIAAASKPPPRFHMPPPKWRGLTMEAAQWTFSPDELQGIVSRAIQNSSEGASIRLLRLETLEGEIADETHRLEMQRTDVKTRYKTLVRKRWTLMGALAGHIEGIEMNDAATAVETLEELSEVSFALDQLSEKLHDIVERLAQLKSLREVHNASALSMALRKMQNVFVRQMAEKERLTEQVDNLSKERDEAWQHAEEVAKDCDDLNDRLMMGGSEVHSPVNDDAVSIQSSRRSARLSALRKSSVRRSQAGLRSRSKVRSRRSSFNGSSTTVGPTVPFGEDVPPVPALPLSQQTNVLTAAHSTGGFSTGAPLSTGGSFFGPLDSADVRAFEQAQREVYDMLGMSVPSSQPSSRPRTISGPHKLRYPSRPLSDSGAGFPVTGLKPQTKARRLTANGGPAIQSVVIDDR